MSFTKRKQQWLIVGAMGLLFLFYCSNYCFAELNAYGPTQVGFFYGLWDGIRSCVTLPLSVIWTNISVFNLNNTGFMYSLGFFIPAIILCEITIPFFLVAWILKVILFLLMLLVGLFARK